MRRVFVGVAVREARLRDQPSRQSSRAAANADKVCDGTLRVLTFACRPLACTRCSMDVQGVVRLNIQGATSLAEDACKGVKGEAKPGCSVEVHASWAERHGQRLRSRLRGGWFVLC